MTTATSSTSSTITTPTIARRLRFDAAHRVYLHESKCNMLHGHGYVVYVHARVKPGNDLDDVGRVIDFGELKHRVGTWIDHYWDHGTILNEDDPLCGEWLSHDGPLHGHKIYTIKGNPTAELLAAHLLGVCQTLFSTSDIIVWKIVLFETENCFAEVNFDK